MKTSSLLIIAFVLMSSLPASAPGQDQKAASPKASKFLKTKFDKGKNITTVTMKTINLSGSMAKEVGNLTEIPQLDLEGYFSYAGDHINQPVDAATLTFKTFSKYPVYQRGQNVVGVLDDQSALILGSTQYKANSRTFGFEEVLTISIPFDAMQKIGGANSFKFILGQREIRFREKELEALRELAKAMNPDS